MSKRKEVIVTIEGHKYDVTRFCSKHPGEGIRGVYLHTYRNKDGTSDFDRYHMTNEPWEILERARNEGEYNGIVYIGKS